MRIKIWLILVVAVFGVSCNQSEPTPQEVTSINSLKDNSRISLDPKLRRALLRVLNKLEMEDKAVLPSDMELTDEEFLKIFGQPANSEDLGSIESKESVEMVGDKPERPYSNQEYNYIPSEPEEKPSETNYETEPVQENNGPQESEFAYLPQTVEQPDQSLENQPTKPTPEDAIFFQLPTPIDIPDQVEEQKEEKPDVITEKEPQITTVQPEIIKNTTKNETNIEIKTALEDLKEINGTDKPLKHTVEFLPSSLIAAFTLQQDDNGNSKKVIPIEFVNQPALVEKRQREILEKEYLLQQQLRILQEEKYRVQGALQSHKPTTNQVQTEKSQESEFLEQREKLRQQELQRFQEAQRVQELEKKRNQEFRQENFPVVNQVQDFKDNRHQDFQRTQEFRQENFPAANQVQDFKDNRHQDFQRTQEFRQENFPAANQVQDFKDNRHQDFQRTQEFRQENFPAVNQVDNRQEFLNQERQRQEAQRLRDFEYNRQEILRQQEYQRQQEFQRQESLRFQRPFQPVPSPQPFNQFRQNEQRIPNHRFQYNQKPFQEIEFQKSIDFRLPNPQANRQFNNVPFSGLEHNRVNRHEPSRFIGNFGSFPQPPVVNNFLAHTSPFLPSDAKEDLNIVSKLLSYNRLPGERITQPSKLIEPPTL